MFKLINEKRAFTLIELVAVIVLLAAVMYASIFYVDKIMNNSKSNIKSDAINEIIQLTKMFMLSNNLNFPIEGNISKGKINLEKNNITYTLDYYNKDLTGGRIFGDISGNIMAVSVTFSDGYLCTMGSGENGCGKSGAKNYIISMQNDDTYLKNDPQDFNRKVFAGDGLNTPNRLKLKENNIEQDYRIISLEEDGAIKVIRDEPYGWSPYDSSSNPLGSRAGTTSDDYCINEGQNSCNAWQGVLGTYRNADSSGKVSLDSQVKNLLNKTFYPILDENVKKNIITYIYTLSPGNRASFEVLYNRSKGINGQEYFKSDIESKIGLLNVRDWLLASSNSYGGSCVPENDGTAYYNGSNTPTYACGQNNYLLKEDYWWWLITPAMSLRSNNYRISGIGDVNDINSVASGAVRPVFYLSNNVNLKGNGTISSPYRIVK